MISSKPRNGYRKYVDYRVEIGKWTFCLRECKGTTITGDVIGSLGLYAGKFKLNQVDGRWFVSSGFESSWGFGAADNMAKHLEMHGVPKGLTG